MEKDNSNESIYWEKEIEILSRSELEGLQLKRLRETITRAKALQSELLVRPEVELLPLGTIPVSEVGKAKRVIDERTL